MALFRWSKPPKKIEPPESSKPIKSSESEQELKIKVLEHHVVEQRQMIRQLLEISTMLAEHKRYELIQLKLHKLSNVLDKIR